MFDRATRLALATLFFVAGTPVIADVLHPVRNWVVDYREEQCVAYRDYGSPNKVTTLGIRPAPNGETYELMVARPRSGPDFATEQRDRSTLATDRLGRGF